jgi:RNA polymerase sigma-70 factor (ECF subfamily)
MVARKPTAIIDVENLIGAGSRRRTALRGAYRDHGGAVYSVAQGLCGREAAADVTREVFLRLSSHPDRFGPGRGSLRATLLRVTQDVAVDTARLESRPAPRASGAFEVQSACTTRSSAAKPDERRLAARVRPLASLSTMEREAIVAVHYGGRTYREAAVALGLSERAVKRRLREALRKLRRSTVSTLVEEVHVDLRASAAPDRGLAEALDSRAVVAHAQGVIMEREGTSASAAYAALLELSDQHGMTLPACAEAVVASAGNHDPRPCLRRATAEGEGATGPERATVGVT